MLSRTRSLRKACNCGGNDYETDSVDRVAKNEWPAASNLIDEEYCAGLSKNRENIADPLILQCIGRANVECRVYLGSEVLYRADSSHLD